MKAKRLLRTSFFCVLLFVLALVSVIFSIPSDFGDTYDMALSSTGIAISRTYYASDLFPTLMQPGYINNGDFHVYANWPGLGFKVIAGWFTLLGNDSIYSARLFSALVYATSTVLFFVLLLRCRIKFEIAIISSLLFIVLPFHHVFAKLVFADIWLLPFWLSCFVLYAGNQKYHWLIIPLAVFGSIGFMWFCALIIPALLVLYCYQRYCLSVGKVMFLVLSLLLFAYLAQYLLIIGFPDVRLFWELKQWSIFSLFYDVQQSLANVIRTIIRLGYEAFAVIVLFIWAMYQYGSAFWKALITNESHVKLVMFVGLTILFTSFLFPAWFITHNNSIAFFSVLIATSFAFILQACMLPPSRTIIAGGTTILVTLAILLAVPYFRSNDKTAFNKAKQIIAHVQNNESQRSSSLTRPNIVFHLSKNRDWDHYHVLTMGVNVATRGYIFRSRKLKNITDLPTYFRKQSSLLNIWRQNFSPHHLYFVTDQDNFVNEQQIKNKFKVSEILLSENLNVYYIEL